MFKIFHGTSLSKFLLLSVFICCFSYALKCTAQEQSTQRYNRIRYHTFHWMAFHTKQFSVYYPKGADSLGAYIARQLPGALDDVKKRMLANAVKAPNVIIYPSTDQQYETNIGSFDPQTYTLPTFVHKGMRLVLAYNGSYADLHTQLYEAIARAAWENELNEGGLQDQANSGKSDIPMWFKEGAIRYFADGWRVTDEDALQNTFKTQRFANWQQVIACEPRLGGQAFCYFLTEKFYKQAAMQLFGQLKKRKSLARAIRLIAKKPLDSLYTLCYDFYNHRFSPEDSNAIPAADSIILPYKKGLITSVTIAPRKQYVAYTCQTYGKRTVYTCNIKTRQTHKIATYPIPPWISDHSRDPYPLLQWGGDGSQLYVLLPEKGKITIKSYTPEGSLTERIKLTGVDGVTGLIPLSPRQFLLAAYRKGQSDIVQYDKGNGRYTAYTDDCYDDQQPATGKNGAIVFVSDRPRQTKQKVWEIGIGYDADTLWQGIYTIADKQIKPVKTDTTCYIRWDKPQPLPDGRILAAGTPYGTARHVLLQPGHMQILSPYKPYQYLPQENEIVFPTINDSIRITIRPMDKWLQKQAATKDTTSPWLTDYRRRQAEQAKEDTLLKQERSHAPTFLEQALLPKDAQKKSAHIKDSIKESLGYSPKKAKPYLLQLQSAYFTAQVNNDYFINRYQPYQTNLGIFKFPEVGGLAKGGFTDLFEDQHVNIGVKLPAASQGSTFFVTYLNTVKKASWGLTYFRDVESLQTDSSNWTDPNGRRYPGAAKVKTHYYEVSVQYPVNYDLTLGIQQALRQDQTIFQATDKYSLDFEDIKSAWSITTLTAEMNKLQPTLPYLYKGFYGKGLLDALKGFSEQEAVLMGATMNLAYHQPLYRYITLVAQAHAGYSAGDQYVLYNLGGVDNNVTVKVDSSVRFPQSAPYAFQSLVTPFRGYYQNTVYGNEYALFNADVYFPLFQTLIPIETALPSINNLQLGLFSDMATATETWNSSNPGNGKWLNSFGCSARTVLAGYPLRIDIAWPGTFARQPVIYFSLKLM